MRWPKVREIKEALTSFFTPPYTTRFPAAVAGTAVQTYRGRVRFDPQACVGCGACAQVCPSGAINVADDGNRKVRTLRVNHGACLQCGQCVEHCITGRGVVNTHFHAPAVSDLQAPEAFESVEKDLVLCESCGTVVACRDHFDWVQERLGAKAYAHPVFLLLTQERLMGLTAAKAKNRLRREDQFLVTCARCRRRIVQADEF